MSALKIQAELVFVCLFLLLLVVLVVLLRFGFLFFLFFGRRGFSLGCAEIWSVLFLTFGMFLFGGVFFLLSKTYRCRLLLENRFVCEPLNYHFVQDFLLTHAALVYIRTVFSNQEVML